MYTDRGTQQDAGEGTDHFMTGFPGGTGNFGDATTLWNSDQLMKAYDMVILSCEGGQYPESKPQTSMDALKAYADNDNGRVFMSHWHNIWIEGSIEGGTQAPAEWPAIATWSNGGDLPTGSIDDVDEVNNPKGPSFATWLTNVMASPARDEIPIADYMDASTGRTTCSAVDETKAERWVTYGAGAFSVDGMLRKSR